MPQVLDGIRVRDAILSELKPRVDDLATRWRAPGLAVVLAGNDPASGIYVRNKIKACQGLGIFSETLTPPDAVTTEELIETVTRLNARTDIDGILVQLPVPKQVDTKRVLLALSPDKDADGIHPCNVGRLVAALPGPRACTPAGIMELLKRYGIAIAGKRAVVVGRSDIVGKPMALLLLHENATVTICHSKTRDLGAITRQADILVAAIGRAGFITSEMVTPGATLIDVGINRITDPTEFSRFFAGDTKREAAFAKRGSVLVGDVHPKAFELAGAYTPVPGGVGPLTIAMLMANTVRAAKMRRGL